MKKEQQPPEVPCLVDCGQAVTTQCTLPSGRACAVAVTHPIELVLAPAEGGGVVGTVRERTSA